MKSSHRHNRRRYTGRRRNEKKRSVITLILIAIFAIAVVIGSVFLGRHLKTKAEISEANRLNDKTTSAQDASLNTEKTSILYSVTPPKKIDIAYLPTEKIAKFEGENNAVSVVFRDISGKIYYSSPVAQILGGQSADNGLMDAAETIRPLLERKCYISACFSLMGHSQEGATTTDAVHAFEQVMIGEIAMSGVDEILLCGLDKIDDQKVSMLCAFSRTYRASATNTVPLGLLIPYSFFSLENANELCRDLADHYEFLAVDYTDAVATEDTSLRETVMSRIDTMQMYLSRYSLRVVLDSENIECDEARNALAESAVYSVQTVAHNLISVMSDE